jgi:hypothetical protein
MDFNQSIFHQPMFGSYPPRQRRDHRLSGSNRYLGGQIADPVIDRFTLAFMIAYFVIAKIDATGRLAFQTTPWVMIQIMSSGFGQ